MLISVPRFWAATVCFQAEQRLWLLTHQLNTPALYFSNENRKQVSKEEHLHNTSIKNKVLSSTFKQQLYSTGFMLPELKPHQSKAQTVVFLAGAC